MIPVIHHIPDNKVHGTNMGPTWVLSAPGGPHVGSMNIALWDMQVITIVTEMHLQVQIQIHTFV